MHWLTLQKRTHYLRSIRELFWSWGFTEVDTPLIVACPGQEPFLDPFETRVEDAAGRAHPGYLITSPEYAMKKLLAKAALGEAPEFGKIFQLGKVFRNNEDFGGTHNPEFTMIEWYRLGADYTDLMTDVETLVCEMVAGGVFASAVAGPSAKANTPPDQLTYQNRTINLQRPWRRITVVEAFKEFAHRDDALELAEKNPDEFYKIFMNEVEPKFRDLEYPIFLTEYPASMAALARKKTSDPHVAERFECYIGGLEIANAFSELTDATEQRARFEIEQQERIHLGKKSFEIDEEFLRLLPHIKKAAGISVGVDRLIMLLEDKRDINDVIFWPCRDLFEAQ
ncbi:MAG: EF-P lysine aminoacylase GenX [Candidatus Magasanikbacteria bacterium RIFCSPHIGHO2_01_FULL_50_8]|uniref:EF-P lysine aminoacylase GenX n=2 Tax=Candidatus Magasanikiibacteriota TaxID=1752731 RepID=A0A1F6LRU8_9BACT|nr:MAG: EF-P lysine aminoacylase GenX [Candidatus Magasanikbacteria bacterium RIFCSPHIGHO2_01_FULL_50_8]OGH67846.1 MAG: EF-P lysine aminoacylase GenX [Candidatus Magasanikbacteria bacterium RIFCSPHIGHO2_02_FULL_50_9b]